MHSLKINEVHPHFINTIAHDVIKIKSPPFVNAIPAQKYGVKHPYYTTIIKLNLRVTQTRET